MNIKDFEETDLHRFLKFCDGSELRVSKEDWDNMCGITISDGHTRVCFNFYEDGKFRCIVQ